MSNFPPLRLAVLTALAGLKDNLEIVDSPDCPYDPETKELLRKLLAPKVVEKMVEKEIMVEAKNARGRPSKDVKLSEDDQQMVIDQIKSTLADLEAMGTGEKGLPTNERIQIAKTKANLTSELLKQMERHTTVQRIEEFKETVIGILDDFMSEADRENIMKRLEPLR
jgi:hypothetical protein